MVILPPSALAKLASLHIEYPMLFQLTNNATGLKTHAGNFELSEGVLEFISEEGRIYVPPWVIKTLGIAEGSYFSFHFRIINVKSTSLHLGKFVKIQPQTVDFLDITDPKAVLENAFRNFSTLTDGDIFEMEYNNKIYPILVMEIKPHGSGISIIGIA